MPSKWMSLSDAYAQFRPHYEDAAKAHMGLLTALRRAEIDARADYYGDVDYYKAVRQQNREMEIPPVFWDLATVDLNISFAKSPDFWPEPGMLDRPNDYFGAHGVHVPRAQVDEIWPAAKPISIAVPISNVEQAPAAPAGGNGAPGRPTSVQLVEVEFKRRDKAGDIENGIGKQAEVLSAWLKTTHPLHPQMKKKTVENAIRVAWNSKPRK